MTLPKGVEGEDLGASEKPKRRDEVGGKQVDTQSLKAYDYDWEYRCPVCGESDSDIYSYIPQDVYQPAPAEAVCYNCDWSFVETSQHNPDWEYINHYRQVRIAELKDHLEQLEQGNDLQASDSPSAGGGDSKAQ